MVEAPKGPSQGEQTSEWIDRRRTQRSNDEERVHEDEDRTQSCTAQSLDQRSTNPRTIVAAVGVARLRVGRAFAGAPYSDCAKRGQTIVRVRVTPTVRVTVM